MKNDSDEILRATIAAHRTLAILRLLNGELRGAANDRLLRDLLSHLGLNSSYQEVSDAIDMLERAGALSSSRKQELTVVELTRVGADIAEGRAEANGVAKPGPECPY